MANETVPHILENVKTLLTDTNPYAEFGLVEDLVGLTIEAKGPKAKISDVCIVETGRNDRPFLQTEVVGFKSGKVVLMPLGEMMALSPGSKVFNTGKAFKVATGEALIGRILDGLGNPIDDRFNLPQDERLPIEAQAPHPLKRKDIDEPLTLGIKAIDGFTTVGKGQRIGIFAGSGVGKSTTMGMIARNTNADISVIALIGERGREVRDFIDNALGEEGLKKSVVIVATSEQPALTKIKAALVATTIAEYFRETGRDVLLMMDSLTRVAMGLREVGLSIGEPPTNKGYTPSVFAFLPKLLERSGTSEVGSITGLYSVLVEADDFNEPVSDTVRGLLDGHIILSRDLAEQNHFPAIDVLGSISRLMVHVASTEHQQAAGKIRGVMAAYKKAEDLINIGAYVQGSNPQVDIGIALKPEIDRLLKQGINDSNNLDTTIGELKKLGLRIP